MDTMFRISVAAVGLVAVVGVADADDKIDFSRDILPVLSNNCFECHGPDEAKREAGLRLDQQDSATKETESGIIAVVAGHSDASELFSRITVEDENLRMPPPDSGKSLTAGQIELIKRWIEGGATWSTHWAFVPPKRVSTPAVVEGWSVNNPIDNFIQAKLASGGLSQEDPADKQTLIRRVTLDLTGLPPTLEEIDQFLSDDGEGAYERVVDRLLASPRYGEHMARFWLDAARYGDTHGLHLDNERSIWLYRNWVIDAFNNNMPFDQFTIEQLAGDLLPDATLSQRVATGFNRCNVTTGEGGSIDDEYYVRYAVDRVETTSTVWMGLTMGCAVCHDHKFDPVTQKEFYQFFSYFYSLTEKAMDGNVALPPPSLKVPNEAQLARQSELNQAIQEADEKIAQLLADFEYTDPTPDQPLGELSEEEFIWIDDQLPAGAKPQGNGEPAWHFVEAPDHPVHSGTKSHWRKGESGAITQHFFTEATDKLNIAENSRLFAYVYIDPTDPPQTIQLQFNDGSWEHRASWGEDKAFLAGANNEQNRLIGPLPETGKWVRLEVTADSVGLKPGSELNGWAFTQVGGTLHWDTAGTVSQSLSPEQKRSLFAWEQFRAKVKEPKLPDDIQAVLNIDKGSRTPEQSEQLQHYFVKHVHPDSTALLAEPLARKADLQRQIKELEDAIPATLVMEDRAEPRQAYVLARGEYTQPKDPVSSAVPKWLAPAVRDAPGNRLGLAQWLVQPEHPLTSRVVVNRYWQQLFGTGLVKTAEDFGVQGEQPSHPDLLDWLATDFVDSGWNIKRCIKQMVMSATYRQSSRVTPEKYAADPDNRLLARGPRFRLDAEIIRDQALAVSGLMNREIGGPSVKPYQPSGLWEPVGFGGSNTAKFVQDSGEKLYRRSMYTFWKRTSPPPSMSTFDAPSRETCQVRRSRTNTPLQALVLMNDVQYVEAARKYAERVMNEGGHSIDDRLEFAFRTMTSRRPSSQESAALSELYHENLALFQNDPESAQKLLSAGESPRNEHLDQSELAAWTMVTHVLLNLSETVTKG